MARDAIEVRTCDRCGKEVELRPRPGSSKNPFEAWGLLYARQLNGPVVISAGGEVTGREAKDICDKCWRELAQWWQIGTTLGRGS